MAIYGAYTEDGGIIRASDNTFIPDQDHRFYREAMAAVAAGDTITAYVAPPPTGLEVDIERERRIALPTSVTLSVGKIAINMDATAQRNIQGLASAGQYLMATGSAQTTTFRDFDNLPRELTPADLISMGLQVAARIQAVYAASWEIKAIGPIPADFADDSRWS